MLFNRTMHENIALGDPAMRACGDACGEAGRRARVHSRAAAGLRHDDRGARRSLSGGQRQRIAIARALVTNPRILILDEATSALDYESERIIQDNMRAIVQGRTVIIIAHRLAAVRPCTRIVGMAQGEVVEIGSHEDLMRGGGLYARLWALQSDRARARHERARHAPSRAAAASSAAAANAVTSTTASSCPPRSKSSRRRLHPCRSR